VVRSRLARAFVLSLAVFALALRASGDEPKTYRWVGEDGHVYTTTTPPPNGKGLIDDAAHERESSIETEAHRAGVPQSCFSD